MRAFRFRAQAALDLRRREYDQALLQQASARRALEAAAVAVDGAQRVIRAAETQLGDAMRLPVTHSQIQWHRAWWDKCVAEHQRLEQEREVRRLEMQSRTEVVTAAYRRVRALERFRELSLAAWNRAALQEERKTMDALATSRFVQGRMDRDEFHIGH